MSFRTYFIKVFIAACSGVTFLCSGAAPAQSWKSWSTTPVFDGGRTMPLHSFSQQIVKEICGSSRPFLVPDDTVLAELNRVVESQPNRVSEEESSLALPTRRQDIYGGLETGLGMATTELQQRREDVTLKIKNMDRFKAERIIQRINVLVPAKGRRFEAPELLFSWFAEPEIWDYIPIIAVSESDYRADVLDVPLRNNSRSRLRHVSVFQLEHSQPFQRRLLDIERRHRQAGGRSVMARYDLITERIERARDVFLGLTFDPRRHYPSQMVHLLQQAGDVSEGSESAYVSGFEAWSYLLGLGGDPARQDRSGPEDAERTVHPTTERWHAISRKIVQLAGAFDQHNAAGDVLLPNLSAMERQFELLLETIDANLDESRALMERVYPGVVLGGARHGTHPILQVESFLPRLFDGESAQGNKEAISRLVLNYHYALKKLRREIEAAYLALYDNGRTLRLLPILSSLPFGDDDSATRVQPWASIRLILHGRDAAICRFLDPDFAGANIHPVETAVETAVEEAANREAPADAEPAVVPGILSQSLTTSVESRATAGDDAAQSEGEDSEREDVALRKKEETPRDERFEIDLYENEDEEETSSTASSAGRRIPSDPIRRTRLFFSRIHTAYAAPGRENTRELFNEAASNFQQSLRDASVRIDAQRRLTAEEDHALNHEIVSEIVAKTSYPEPGVVHPEYRYFRLAPFFWMWLLAAVAILFGLVSFLIGIFRREMIDTSSMQAVAVSESGDPVDDRPIDASWTSDRRPDFSNSSEEYFLWGGIVMLGLSILITIYGGAIRAWITGWAPVTNMYETVVLMACSVAIIGLWLSLQPLIDPILSLAWRSSAFPALSDMAARFRSGKTSQAPEEPDSRYAMRQIEEEIGFRSGVAHPDLLVDSLDDPVSEVRRNQERKTYLWQWFLALPRVILMFLVFLCVVYISYSDVVAERGFPAAVGQLLTVHDFIDWLVVVASVGLIVWIVPHLLLTAILFFVFLHRPRTVAASLGILSYSKSEPSPAHPRRGSEMSSVFHGETAALHAENVDNSGSAWLTMVRNRILDRKLFILVAAAITCVTGVIAQYNTTEFNPNIRPLVAVLRSNFWLTIHVIAIIVSYAAAMIAWGMAAVALGAAIFGRYRHDIESGGDRSAAVRLPALCEMFAPIILRLVRGAMLLLIVGTILGARWADYSWGRFWSWDPKEVWALITILFYAILLHGRIARYYGAIGITVGALYGSLAVLFTWYGINFVFKGSIHSYGGDALSQATIFLWTFACVNVAWGILALLRYGIEVHGNETG